MVLYKVFTTSAALNTSATLALAALWDILKLSIKPSIISSGVISSCLYKSKIKASELSISEKLDTLLKRIEMPFFKFPCSILNKDEMQPILLETLILCCISIDNL